MRQQSVFCGSCYPFVKWIFLSICNMSMWMVPHGWGIFSAL